MSVVVDASVLVAAAVDSGPEGRWAEQLVENESLSGPGIVQVEATNILRRLEIAGRIDGELAETAYRDLLDLDIDLFPFAPFAGRVWALRANVTSYDACYIALAEILDMPLATLDRRLARASGPRCRFQLPD